MNGSAALNWDYRPDGRRFLSSVELEQRVAQAQQRAEQTLLEAVPRLLALGLTVQQIADSLGLEVATVQAITAGNHSG